MLPSGEDENIRKRFRSLRDEEEREAPSYDRVVAGAVGRRDARRSIAPWLAMAALALAATAAPLLATSWHAERPAAPAPAEASGRPPVAAPPVTEPVAPVDANPQKAEVEPLPVADPPSRKNAKTDRTNRRQKPAPHEQCEEC